MRTAVCVAGLPREVREVWRTFVSNLLLNLPNPDVFIHTGEQYPIGPDYFTTVKPKKYRVEPQYTHPEMDHILNFVGYYDNGHLPKCIQQMFGLKKVWELVKDYENETGVKYDLVVRTRPDILMLKLVTLDMIQQDKINTLHNGDNFLVSSEFAIGPYDKMQHYFGIYDWMLQHGEKILTKTHPRLSCTSDNLYHNDIFFTVYLLDCLGFKIGSPSFIPRESPYDYYRIMNRHRKNEYTYDPSMFYHNGGPNCSPQYESLL